MAPFVPESSFQLIWDNGFGSKRQARNSLQAPFGAVRQPHRKSKMSGYCSCHYCFRFGSGSVAFSAALASLRSLVPGGHKKTLRRRTETEEDSPPLLLPPPKPKEKVKKAPLSLLLLLPWLPSLFLPPIKADGTFLCPSPLTQCVFLP